MNDGWAGPPAVDPLDDPIARQLGFGRAFPPRTLGGFARAGLGADFQAMIQIPEFKSAWNDVAAQLAAEGATGLEVQSAQDTLLSAYSDLTTGKFGVQASAALSSAKEFTLAAKTVAGAVDHVAGLVAAAQSARTGPEVAAVFQMFTGTLIGLAATAGLFTAGVGSLIVAGIGIALNVLSDLGFFGHAPVGTEVCPGVYCNPPPDWVIGCVCAWGPRISPGAASWRTFPDPSDVFWFGNPAWNTLPVHPTPGAGSWHGASFNAGGIAGRPIDVAFPSYAYLELEEQALTPEIADFQRAFYAAWKANKEYALNGLAAQPDFQVLLHLARVWNRAHEPGATFTIDRADRTTLPPPPGVYGPIQKPASWGNAKLRPYAAMLIDDILTTSAATDANNSMQNGSLVLNTGARKGPKRVVELHFAKILHTAAPSTGKKVAIGAAVATGAVVTGSALYAWAQGEAFGQLWKGLWRRVF